MSPLNRYQRNINELKALAKNVQLPESVQSNVLDAVRAGNVDASLRRRSRQPRILTRRTALRVGALAAGTAVAFLGLSLLSRPHDADPGAATGNTFTLRAYAEGIPQGDNTVLAQKSISMGGSSGGSRDSGWYMAHDIDLTCQGVGITTISYSIEGDYVSETGQPPENAPTRAVYLDVSYSRPYEIGEGESAPDGNGTPTGFTVSYEGQEADSADFNRRIWTYFPDDEELAECNAALQQTYGAKSTYEEELAAVQANDAFRFLLEKRSAEILAQTTLVMTVTFEDGSTQAKRYVIAPISDFDEVLQSYFDDNVELSAYLDLYRDVEPKPEDYEEVRAQVQEHYGTWPDLYTITEFDG